MRVMTVFGGPRKNGNTATVLGWIEKELRAMGHETDRVNTTDFKIEPCNECNYCMANPSDTPSCIQEDDANAIFTRMLKADIIIFASPLFFWSFPAQIRPLMDRMYSLVSGYGTLDHKSMLAGRRVGLLLTGADAYANNAEMAVEVFRRIAGYIQCSVAGVHYVSHCTMPDELGADVKEQAIEFAHKIGA